MIYINTINSNVLELLFLDVKRVALYKLDIYRAIDTDVEN